MRTFFLVLGLAGCSQTPWPEQPLPDACAAGGLPQEEMVMRIQQGDLRRAALVWAPSGAGPHDVIVNLHEFNSEPKRQQYYTKMLEYAKAHNAILVGPDGKTATWNAGACCSKARDRGYNDVEFLDEIMKRIDATGCTSGRVLAAGIGNGGMMAEAWACESDYPDAVLSVGGALQMDACNRSRPIPVVHYHGSLDTWMPADGSGHHRPVSEAMGFWSKRNSAALTTPIDGGDLHCDHYEGTAPIWNCTVSGMPDHWPGAADADSFHGPDGKVIDATVDGIALLEPWWKAN